MIQLVLHCQPGAKQTQVVGWHGGRIKIQLKAPPVDGKANDILLAFLSDALGVPRKNVVLASGQTQRIKRVSIDGLALDQALARLGLGPPEA
ncbi:MAG: DUF167 domain-containing protein [Betaproteobacteria bacterium]|jgi:uncharacterized protein|nr:DUF167 domain-containing protein [Betaproteobacteria bacterium]NBP43886.1 DUF167 domain-containing protein [Betaproteobacteria bacterium]